MESFWTRTNIRSSYLANLGVDYEPVWGLFDVLSNMPGGCFLAGVLMGVRGKLCDNAYLVRNCAVPYGSLMYHFVSEIR